MAKFTFKMHKETGLRAIAYKPTSDIKVRGVVIGAIQEGRVRFMVKKERTELNPAPFRWATLKKVFESDGDAREFLRETGVDALLKAHDIYFDDEDR